jgi:hypothetical protein
MIEGLMKNYPWWMPTTHVERTAAPSDRTEDMVSLFEGKNMKVLSWQLTSTGECTRLKQRAC